MCGKSAGEPRSEAIDLERQTLDMESGVEDPGDMTRRDGTGRENKGARLRAGVRGAIEAVAVVLLGGKDVLGVGLDLNEGREAMLRCHFPAPYSDSP